MNNSRKLNEFFTFLKSYPEQKHDFLRAILHISYFDGRQEGEDILLTIINNYLLELDDSDYKKLQKLQKTIAQNGASVRKAEDYFFSVNDHLPNEWREIHFNLCVALMLADGELSDNEWKFISKLSQGLEKTSRPSMLEQAAEILNFLRRMAAEKLGMHYP